MTVEIRAEDGVSEAIEGGLYVFASFVDSHWWC
jgi:hypothetical protein